MVKKELVLIISFLKQFIIIFVLNLNDLYFCLFSFLVSIIYYLFFIRSFFRHFCKELSIIMRLILRCFCFGTILIGLLRDYRLYFVVIGLFSFLLGLASLEASSMPI